MNNQATFSGICATLNTANSMEVGSYWTIFFKYLFGIGAASFVFLALGEVEAPGWWLLVMMGNLVASSWFAHEGVQDAYEEKFRETWQKLTENQEILRQKDAEVIDARQDEKMWKETLKEKSSGFPTLMEAIQAYQSVKDEAIAYYLRTKSHSAQKAADIVKEQTRLKRQAELEERKTRSIIEYYEKIFPELVEYKNEFIGELGDDSEYSEEQSQDPVSQFMTKEEYEKLSNIERNQMALDRFWNRRNKSNKLIGQLYERYVGYVYESKGYDVKYFGIKERLADLGRDLICHKGHEILVIQCKRWAKFKTIHEKHIFQLFGTVFLLAEQLKEKYPDKNVKGIFCTSTIVSEVAQDFGNRLGLEIIENFKFDNEYPCIKCNISKVDSTKIYHLPFDQQYDTVKIEPNKGEFYAKTVREAEEIGFRRAFRYSGFKKKL